MREVFPDAFIDKIISTTKIKIYDFKDTEAQRNRKKKYKNDFIRNYKDKIKLHKVVDNEDYIDGIEPEEIDMINDFLSGILVPAEGSKADQIDIKLALKSLPSHIDETNMHRCLMFNYANTKAALIGF